MEYPTQKMNINGLSMNVLIAGEGEPVLLVHGFPDTHEVWRKQIPVLIEAGYRVIAPDTRGCGDSEAPPDVSGYHRDLIVNDLRTLLDELKIDKVKLVGHDWGAVQGWQLALEYPERVERYIPLSVGHPTAYGSGGIGQKLKGWYVLIFQIPYFPEWLLKTGNWWFFRKFTAFAEEFPHWRQNLSRPGRLTAGINYYRANTDLFFHKEWKKTRVPVYGIVSNGDRYLTVKQMRDSADSMEAPFQYEVIDGANHWLQLHRPEKVNPVILKFLKGGG